MQGGYFSISWIIQLSTTAATLLHGKEVIAVTEDGNKLPSEDLCIQPTSNYHWISFQPTHCIPKHHEPHCPPCIHCIPNNGPHRSMSTPKPHHCIPCPGHLGNLHPSFIAPYPPFDSVKHIPMPYPSLIGGSVGSRQNQEGGRVLFQIIRNGLVECSTDGMNQNVRGWARVLSISGKPTYIVITYVIWIDALPTNPTQVVYAPSNRERGENQLAGRSDTRKNHHNRCWSISSLGKRRTSGEGMRQACVDPPIHSVPIDLAPPGRFIFMGTKRSNVLAKGIANCARWAYWIIP